MSYAQFIDETYLKDTMPIDDNVEQKHLRTAIRDAQEVYIRDLVGSGIYDDITSQINDTGLDAKYTELVNEYLAPALARYVLYESADVLCLQIINKGIQNRNSEFSNPADMRDVTGLALKFKQRADFYAKKATLFLCENQNTYPLYKNPGSAIDTVHPSESFLYGGIYLGDYDERERWNNKNPNPNP